LDISGTIAPDSPQLDAVDLTTGPQTFTITRATPGAADQPVNLHLAEFPRPWRPGLSMRRVLVALWGGETDAYAGRRVTLFCDPTVEFGGQAVGGIRIKAMSHIDGPKKVPLIISRGKSAMYPVSVLKEEAAPPPATEPAPLPDRIASAVAAYARANVTLPMLEAKVALPREEWAERTVADLEALYARLVARETTKEAEFDMPGDDQ
jgi:hypothetical protein